MVLDGENNSWEGSRKRRAPRDQDGGREVKRHDHVNRDPLLKLLVPDYAVGALLGKGGALLNELKNTHGGHIRLSGKREYYPGTDERVIVIIGETNQLSDINTHIMEKVQDPGYIIENSNRAQKVKIVLTDSAAGMLIGPKGATIQAIHSESRARISIAVQSQATVPGERVLTMSGSFDQRTAACKLIIEKIAGEPSNVANSNIKYRSDIDQGYDVGFNSMASGFEDGASSFNDRRFDDRASPSFNDRRFDDRASSSFNDRHFEGRTSSSFNDRLIDDRNHFHSEKSLRREGDHGSYYRRGAYVLKENVVVTIEIPNELVGGVMGKQGTIIKEFVQRSGGARFKFTDKSSGAERTLTITGNMEQCQTACSLVSDRVEELSNPPTSQRFY